MSREYQVDQIKEYIDSKSNRIFSNSNKDLFKALLQNIFKNANEINWLISNLNKMKFFLNDENFDLIEQYLKNENTLNIITSEINNTAFLKFTELSKIYKNFTFTFKDFVIQQDILTWDKVGYRFAPDKNRLTGVACANDLIFTEKCNKIIEKVVNM